MAFLDGIQHWSFNGILLARRIASESEWEEWFEEDTIASIEPILDTSLRYVDIGGVTYGAISIPFAFPDLEARGAFLALRGTSGMLARTGYNPKSRLVLFRRAQEVASANDLFTVLNCTFEAL